MWRELHSTVSRVFSPTIGCHARLRWAPRRAFASSSGHAGGTQLLPPLLPSVAPSLAPVILALVLLHAVDQSTRSEDETDALAVSTVVPYSVKDVQGSGVGAIATRDIERGEVIITDQPLLLWPQGISNEEADTLIARLLPQARERFDALSNAQPQDRGLNETLGKRATNAFAVQVPTLPAEMRASVELASIPDTVSFLYPNIARINHSCLPNADHAIDWSTLRMTVYASSPIKCNDEVTIEYVPLVTKPRSARQNTLKRSFGFDCACQVCGADTQQSVASDERRTRLAKLVDWVADKGSKGTSESRRAVIEALERIRILLEDEGYKALPDLGNEAVSRAYVLYMANRPHFQETLDVRQI